MTAKRNLPSGSGRPKDRQQTPGVNRALGVNKTRSISKNQGANRSPSGPNMPQLGMSRMSPSKMPSGKLNPQMAEIMNQVSKATGRKRKEK